MFDSNDNSACGNGCISSILELLREWSDGYFANRDGIREKLVEKEEDYLIYNILSHLASDITIINNDLQHSLIRLCNAIRIMNYIHATLVNQYGDEIVKLIPKIPIGASYFVVDKNEVNKDDLN